MEYFSAIINLLANLAKLARLMPVLLSLGFAWKDALVNVTPKTFIGWHRAEFRLSLAKYRVSFAQASRGHLNLLRGAGPLRGRRLPGNTISARVSAAGVGEDAKTGQLFVN